jgi:hypothetical protein
MQCEHALRQRADFGKKAITVHVTTTISGISVGSVETIINGHLLFKTLVCPVGSKGVNV